MKSGKFDRRYQQVPVDVPAGQRLLTVHTHPVIDSESSKLKPLSISVPSRLNLGLTVRPCQPAGPSLVKFHPTGDLYPTDFEVLSAVGRASNLLARTASFNPTDGPAQQAIIVGLPSSYGTLKLEQTLSWKLC
jgi:hypothetical protein